MLVRHVIHVGLCRNVAAFEEELRAVWKVFVLPMRPAHTGGADPYYLGGGKIGEIDVVDAPVTGAEVVQQFGQNTGKEQLDCGEVRIVAEIVQAHRDGGDAVQGRFHCRADGAGVKSRRGSIAAVVDSAQHQVGFVGIHHIVQPEFHATRGRAVQIPPFLSWKAVEPSGSDWFITHADCH